jgi:diaminopimelate epimerase
MKIDFVKMHALGNDFVIINNVEHKISLEQLPIAQLGHRHFGIGFDQLLVIETIPHADFLCRIFNADGSEAEQCGNGLRCVARFLFDAGLAKSANFTIATSAGCFPVQVKANGEGKSGGGDARSTASSR